MRITFYSEKDNTLYINSDIILPDTKKLPFKEHLKLTKQAFAKSYEERIEQYATKEQQEHIHEQLKAHEGCKISEFCDM